MNFFDILVLGFLALFLINGFRKGFIISLATLVALVLGIYLAVHFSNYIQDILVDKFHPSRTWLPYLSFSLTFLIVALLVILVAKLLEKVIDLVGLGIFNKIAGALLGLLKGLVFASIILFVVYAADKKQKWITADDRKGSFTMNRVERIFPEMMQLFGCSLNIPLLGEQENRSK